MTLPHTAPRQRARFTAALLLALGTGLAQAPLAQEVEGTVFNDVNGNGTRDAGEPPIDQAPVSIWSSAETLSGTQSAGTFGFRTSAAGCHGLDVGLFTAADPSTFQPGYWRRGLPDQAWEPPAGSDPVGLLRLSAPDHLFMNAAGGLSYISMGDSIAAGVSFCAILLQDTNYVPDVAAGLDCLTGGGSSYENRAVGGAETDDLLIPAGGGNRQYVGAVVQAAPEVVTISIGGNDYLNTEPNAAGQDYPYVAADLQRSFLELIDVRRNLQEILSTLVSELPDADVELNTVYDNEARTCATTDFHAAATTTWNQALRMAAWGQRRPVLLAEVHREFAHQDVLRATCGGFQNKICTGNLIHPSESGTLVIEEAVMEALGRVDVAPTGITSGVSLGYQELVATLRPTLAVSFAGTVTNGSEAFALDGLGATVGFDAAQLELSGFTLPPGVTPTRVVVGVRFRTTGNVADDRYRMDASFLDFAAPAFTWTGWDTQTPLAGSAGQPVTGTSSPRAVVNVVRNVPAWRDVSNTVTLNAVDDGRVTGFFTWPSPTADDISRLKVRVTTETVGVVDAASLEIDGAWAWVFGTGASATPVPDEVSPPGASTPLTVVKAIGGVRVAWQAEPASATYRVYDGEIPYFDLSVVNPAADLGGCTDQLDLFLPNPIDSTGSRFYLVAGVNAAGVRGTLGHWSDGTERVSGPASCP